MKGMKALLMASAFVVAGTAAAASFLDLPPETRVNLPRFDFPEHQLTRQISEEEERCSPLVGFLPVPGSPMSKTFSARRKKSNPARV